MAKTVTVTASGTTGFYRFSGGSVGLSLTEIAKNGSTIVLTYQ